MSKATDTAHKALEFCNNFPQHVLYLQQAFYIKELAEHVIRLQADVDKMMPLVEAVGACSYDSLPNSVYQAWKQPSEYQRTCAECGAKNSESSAWQPIETAPKDGTLILIRDKIGRVQVGKSSCADWCVRLAYWDGNSDPTTNVVQWARIPE